MTLDLVTPNMQETTRLESGQTLRHHRRDECDGECCLHGTSPYPGCRYWRLWRHERGQLEHHCPCGVGHPCAAAAAHAARFGYPFDGVHGCCGVPGHCGTGTRDASEEETQLLAAVQDLDDAHVQFHRGVLDHLEMLREYIDSRLLWYRDVALALSAVTALSLLAAVTALVA